MSIFDVRKLREDELIEFKRLMEKYKDYDKVDLLIHKTLKILGISYYEFQSRKIKQANKKQVKIVQQEGNVLNSFCDSEKCQFL